ncbi:MAG: 4-hydroxy-tetrahydrodipicolinate reductase [Candidatus Omnitrophica bacterium]|nr:4-hydroxy-tetrahydrodipicolinate reductase [Candidatus Omnitrophota bacterium]
MIRLALSGACGKMAAHIMTLAAKDREFKVTGAFEAPGHPKIGKRVGDLLGLESLDAVISGEAEKAIAQADVVIDFSHRDATAAVVRACEAQKKALVIGTTGLTEETLALLREAAKKIAIVQSPNMSAGVNLLFKIVETVASKLGEDYDIEIVEAHHKHKKDAPSGTALELARRAAAGRKVDLARKAVYGREGLTGERERGAIGIHAVRGGDVVGDHTVAFMAEGERVELTHKASSREAFAKGALIAAKYLYLKKIGLFSMQDVLGV